MVRRHHFDDFGPSKLWLEEPAFPRATMRAETALSCLALTAAFIDLNDRSGVRWPSGLGRSQSFGLEWTSNELQ
jgi:hypothetical protein